MNRRLKVGDRVRWSGRFPKYKEGVTKKMVIDALKIERKKTSYNFDEFMAKYTDGTVYKRGVGKIKKVHQNYLGLGHTMIELNNGKLFEMDDDKIKIVK
jgi:hypothetical protein